MYKLFLFDSPEDHYDCVCGCTPTNSITFTSEEAAAFYFNQEFGDQSPYISTPQELAQQRNEHLAVS